MLVTALAADASRVFGLQGLRLLVMVLPAPVLVRRLVMVPAASSVESFPPGRSSFSVYTRQLVFCGIGLPLFYLG